MQIFINLFFEPNYIFAPIFYYYQISNTNNQQAKVLVKEYSII